MDLSSGGGVSQIGPKTFQKHEGPGRPKLQIQSEMLEELRGIKFPWVNIADMFWSFEVDYFQTCHGVWPSRHARIFRFV